MRPAYRYGDTTVGLCTGRAVDDHRLLAAARGSCTDARARLPRLDQPDRWYGNRALRLASCREDGFVGCSLDRGLRQSHPRSLCGPSFPRLGAGVVVPPDPVYPTVSPGTSVHKPQTGTPSSVRSRSGRRRSREWRRSLGRPVRPFEGHTGAPR